MCALQIALSPELGQSGVRSLSYVVSPSYGLASERVRVSVYPSCKGLGPLGRQWYKGYHHSFRIPDRAAFDYGRLKWNIGFEIRGSSGPVQELAQLSAEDPPGAVQRAAEGDIAREAEGHESDDEKNAFRDVQLEEEEAEFGWEEGEELETAEEAFGEVDLILASRVEDRKTQYLILWKDDHPDSWEPAANIARDLVAEYEKLWWQAARKADIEKLKELLEEAELQRDVNAIDENERTALFFAAGLGSEKCVRFLIQEYGADVHWQDKDGFTALHIASGYVHVNTVKALVELGADPDLEDAKGRSALSLAQELLNRTPKANPLQFSRRLALDQVVKALDEVMYETVEVEQVLDKRTVEGEIPEYFVRWSDDSENSWIPATDIGEDLIKDYEEGLEYGVVEQVVDRREVDGAVQYFVKWSDGKETWEPEENVGEEVVAEFHSSQSTQ